MELFPAQPDLSLQISPPSTTIPNPSKLCPHKRSLDHEHDDLDLGFWKTSLIKNDPSTILSKQRTDPNLTLFNPSLFNPSTRGYSSSSKSKFSINNITFPHHHLLHTSSLPNLNDLQHQATMKPIRGIPIYQSSTCSHPFPPSAFPHYQSLLLESFPSLSNSLTNIKINGSVTSQASCLQSSHDQNHQGCMRSRFLAQSPRKKSVRTPRMRWTSSLHARFVRAVELLSGHESN